VRKAVPHAARPAFFGAHAAPRQESRYAAHRPVALDSPL
jgi:hypothetical protein